MYACRIGAVCMWWVGACLRQKWLPGAGSSEIMLLVTGYLRLVTVRGDGEVKSHVRLVVERYARGKSRPCVLCMHHHDEPSNDSATTKLPIRKSTTNSDPPSQQLH